MSAKPKETTLTFDPETMRYDRRDSKIIYDSTRRLTDSAATTKGYLYIGVKDKPTSLEIKDTIMHERYHIGHKVAKTYLQAAQQELQAYQREKDKSSPQRWNRILRYRSVLGHSTSIQSFAFTFNANWLIAPPI